MIKNWLPAEFGCMARAMERTPAVCFRSFFKSVLSEFTLNAVSRTAHTCSVRASSLDHETVDHTMENKSVIEAFFTRLIKLLTVLGAMSGYSSAFITSPFSIVIVTIGFAKINRILSFMMRLSYHYRLYKVNVGCIVLGWGIFFYWGIKVTNRKRRNAE